MKAHDPVGPRNVMHLGEVAGVAATLVDELNRIGVHSEQRLLPTPAPRSPLPVKALFGAPRALAAARLRSELRATGAIAHVHFATWGVWFIGRHPLVVHCHGTDVRDPDRVRRALLRRTFAASELVVAATPDLLACLPDDARYLPNPVDTTLFAPTVPPREATRDVLVFSALTEVKGAMETLEVVRELKRLRPGLHISAIAHGPHVPEFSRQGVEMVPYMTAGELPALLNDHRIVLGQRRLGVAGTSELQAMACGRPVVMPLSAAVDPGLRPPVTSARDPRLAAAEALALLDDAERLEHSGSEARRWTVANHRVEAVGRKLATWYEEIG